MTSSPFLHTLEREWEIQCRKAWDDPCQSASLRRRGEEERGDSGKIKFTRHSASLFDAERLTLNNSLSSHCYRIDSTTAAMICSFVIKMLAKNNFIEYNQVEFQLNGHDDENDEDQAKRRRGRRSLNVDKLVISFFLTCPSFSPRDDKAKIDQWSNEISNGRLHYASILSHVQLSKESWRREKDIWHDNQCWTESSTTQKDFFITRWPI